MNHFQDGGKLTAAPSEKTRFPNLCRPRKGYWLCWRKRNKRKRFRKCEYLFVVCVCVKFNYSGRNVSLNNFGHLSTIVYSAGITLEPFSTSFLVSPLKIFTLSWHSLPSCTLRVVRDSNCPYYCPNARSQAHFQSGQFNIVLSLSWKCQEGSQDYSQTLC